MIAYSTHYRDGKRAATDLSIGRAGELAKTGEGFVWLALRDPSPDELSEVAAAFGRSAADIDDAGAGASRTKLEGYKGRTALGVRSPRGIESGRVAFGETKLLVGPTYVISVFRDCPDSAGAQGRLEELDPDLVGTGPGAVVWAILDDLVDGYEPVTAQIDDAIDRLEQQVFAGDDQATQATYTLLRDTIELHRAGAQLKDPLDAIVEGELVRLPDKLEPFLRDVASHLRRIDEHVAAQREVLSGTLDANLTLISVRQNDIVQKISAWATIIAIPAVLASIMGMNFTHMPGVHATWGYPAALALMAVAVIILYGFFKRISWL